MVMNRHFEAVIFDLDGTLLDTLEDLADSANRALERAGLPVHPVDAYRYFVGDGLENLVRRTLPPHLQTNQMVERLLPEVRREYAARWANKTRPYPGIPSVLRKLTEREFPIAILSNKPDEATHKAVNHFFPGVTFKRVIGARPNVPKKPHPASALEIAQAMDLPPASIVYVGDTNTDMRTAVAAGMYPVGVLWGFRTAEELLEHGAREVVKTPGDLLRLILEYAP